MLAQHNCLHWANVVDKRQVNVFLAVGTMLAQRCRPALYLTLVQRMRNVHLTNLYWPFYIKRNMFTEEKNPCRDVALYSSIDIILTFIFLNDTIRPTIDYKKNG